MEARAWGFGLRKRKLKAEMELTAAGPVARDGEAKKQELGSWGLGVEVSLQGSS